jgi:hypothetical protein
MTNFELLQKTARDLAQRLAGAGETQRRRLAASLAQAAVARTGLAHPVISEALTHLEDSCTPNPSLRARVTALTEQLDDEYFQLQESEEDGDEKDPTVLDAFSKARAAAAVAAALGEESLDAAAETAYEAIAATVDVAHLTAIADKVLAK